MSDPKESVKPDLSEEMQSCTLEDQIFWRNRNDKKESRFVAKLTLFSYHESTRGLPVGNLAVEYIDPEALSGNEAIAYKIFNDRFYGNVAILDLLRLASMHFYCLGQGPEKALIEKTINDATETFKTAEEKYKNAKEIFEHANAILKPALDTFSAMNTFDTVQKTSTMTFDTAKSMYHTAEEPFNAALATFQTARLTYAKARAKFSRTTKECNFIMLLLKEIELLAKDFPEIFKIDYKNDLINKMLEVICEILKKKEKVVILSCKPIFDLVQFHVSKSLEFENVDKLIRYVEPVNGEEISQYCGPHTHAIMVTACFDSAFSPVPSHFQNKEWIKSVIGDDFYRRLYLWTRYRLHTELLGTAALLGEIRQLSGDSDLELSF